MARRCWAICGQDRTVLRHSRSRRGELDAVADFEVGEAKTVP